MEQTMAHRVHSPNQQRVGDLKSAKKAYPPTEQDLRWVVARQEHADRVLDDEDGLPERTLHFFRRMRAEAALAAEAKAMHTYEYWAPFCESEIEKMFLMSLISKQHDEMSLVMLDPTEWGADPAGFLANDMLRHLDWEIGPRGPTPIGVMMQVPVGSYRVDFLLYGIYATHPDQSTWVKIPLIVECDGHDFHEKTKDQAKRDKKRDRALMAQGYHCMRFTGAEIWRDPEACVNEAVNFVIRQQNIQERQMMKALYR
jgi:very-short-patch-repair endonuclease